MRFRLRLLVLRLLVRLRNRPRRVSVLGASLAVGAH
jgi:hypothetical protein